MFIELSQEEIIFKERKGVAMHISLWDTLENVKRFYSDSEGVYAAYEDKNPIHALATPIRAYKIKPV